MKRIIDILLVCSLLISFSACSSGTVVNEGFDTTDPMTDSPVHGMDSAIEALEALDYGGRNVNILTQTANSFEHGWEIDEICVEDLTGDPVNDAIYYRNVEVEKLLGVKINQTVENEEKKLREAVNAGDTVYDIVATPSDFGMTLVYNGLVKDLNSSDITEYLNTENSWWAQHWIDEAEVNGRLYAVTGSPSLSLSRFTMVMFYNKTLGKRFGLEDPYSVVNSGKWTVDYLNTVTPSVYNDLDGDGRVNGLDSFGITFTVMDNCDMLWSAFDMDLIKKGEDGWYEFNESEGDRIASAFDKVYKLVNESKGTFTYIDRTNDRVGLNDVKKMFSRGTVLTAPLHLKYAESQYLKYMAADAVALPLPKYDEAQDDYYSFVQEQHSVFMIPISASDPELSGAVLEAMAYESGRTLQPTYLDSVTKGKYTRDEATGEIIDKIMANIKIDAAFIYGEQLMKPATRIFGDLIAKRDRNFEGRYAIQKAVVSVSLSEFKRVLEAATGGE